MYTLHAIFHETRDGITTFGLSTVASTCSIRCRETNDRPRDTLQVIFSVKGYLFFRDHRDTFDVLTFDRRHERRGIAAGRSNFSVDQLLSRVSVSVEFGGKAERQTYDLTIS